MTTESSVDLATTESLTQLGGDSAFGILVPDQWLLIESCMPLAHKVSKKYARRFQRYEPECIAEANYLLCDLFATKQHLYEHEKGGDRCIIMFVSRGLTAYFKEWRPRMSEIDTEPPDLNNDPEMLDYLRSLFDEDDDANTVFRYMRDGISFEDVDILEPRLRRTISRIRFQASARVQRIQEFNRLSRVDNDSQAQARQETTDTQDCYRPAV